MKTKKISIFLACVLCGVLTAFLGHHYISRQSTASHFQHHLSGQTKAIANTGSAANCPQRMQWIEGGTFRMGSDNHYAEEHSAENVTVGGFCIDKYEVTNAEFARFAKETGYVTVAERSLPADEFPNLSEAQRVPGSLVFKQPSGNSPVRELSWWHWVPGANWRHPEGPDSTIQDKENYPVVHIAYEDAEAYSKWAGKSLPTEAQWEFAAKGGLKEADYTWGNQYSPKKANTWQGIFPVLNNNEDGYVGIAPIASFEPNGYGLYDMAGNVWEWTKDWYHIGHDGKANKVNPTVTNPKESFDPREPGVAKHVIKGGSYLCAPNYCSRYRPAAREAESPDTGTSHIGFRLVKIPETDKN